MTSSRSQVALTDTIKNFIRDVPGDGIDFCKNIEEKIFTKIYHKPYTEDEKENEATIRWTRTASEIIEDSYVYRGKCCTDETIIFIACCNARGYDTHFDKLIKEKDGITYTHSIAEVKLADTWYLFDVNGTWGIQKGELTNASQIHGYTLWKKGKDAWDIGLTGFQSQSLIE